MEYKKVADYQAPSAEAIALEVEDAITGTVGGDTPPYQEEPGE